MSILLIAPRREMQPWKQAILEADSSLEVEIYPNVADASKITAAVLWNHPVGILTDFSNLKWISSLGAGVDHILKDKNIPDHIRITRIVDPGIGNEMTKMIITMLTEFEKGIFRHWDNKQASKWEPSLLVPRLKVGLLGMGEVGRKVADILTQLNYSVSGFSSSGRPYKDIKIFQRNELGEFLKTNNVFICLLPLTDETIQMVDKNLLSQIPKGSYFMNLARGRIVDEKAMMWAIENDIIKSAYLDVFETEPLPDDHPFWNIKEIVITPHISGITDVHAAARQIIDNYYTFEKSGELMFEIDKHKGY